MGFRGWTSKSTNKYGARKSCYGGERTDSTNEGKRFLLLNYRQKHGEISCLRRQVSFEIIGKMTKQVAEQLKTKVRFKTVVLEQDARYTCDFVYFEGGKYIMEEFKSEMTAKLADYILRRKLMLWKIKKHNEKGRSIWVFREVVYTNRGTKIRDIEP